MSDLHPVNSRASSKPAASQLQQSTPANLNQAGLSSSDLPGDASKRPSLRKRVTDKPSSIRRYKYSTDDNTEEVEQDLEREYMEGYHDGLKRRLRQRSVVGTKTRSPHIAAATSTAVPSDISIGSPRKRPSVVAAVPAAASATPAAADIEPDNTTSETAPDNDGQSVHSYHGDEPASAEIDNPEDDEGDNSELDLNDDSNDSASVHSNSSVETFTLRERQDAINTTHPFGIRIWKPAVYKKIRSVQKIAEGDIHSQPGKQVSWPIWFGNVLWTLLFGTVLFCACSLTAAFCFATFWSESSQLYGKAMFNLGSYLFFPFGKYVELAQDENYLDEDVGQGRSIADYQRWQAGDIEHGRLFFSAEAVPRVNRSDSMHSATASRKPTTVSNTSVASVNIGSPLNQQQNAYPESSSSALLPQNASEPNEEGEDEDDNLLSQTANSRRRFFGRGQWNIGRVLFYFWFWVLIFPLMSLISLICWLCVFSVPMAKVSAILTFHLRRHPLALSFRPAKRLNVTGRGSTPESSEEESRIILCTYRAWGWKYYKYTIDGTNIIILNLMFPVLFVIFDYYVLHEFLDYNSFIASTAFLFSMSLMSVIPLAYFIGQAVASISAQTSMGMGAAINAFFSTVVEVYLYAVALKQGKGDLVEGSIVGSIFTGVLVLPGLSMCAGAIKRKTQRYNPRSAGVSSTMLVFAVVGAFAPTVFYQIFGTYEMICPDCFPSQACRQCYFAQVPLVADSFYFSVIQPFGVLCAVLLFLGYFCGLWFTLRTHAALIWAAGEKEPVVSSAPSNGHQLAPSQSRKHSVAQELNAGTNAGPSLGDAPPVEQSGGHDAPNWSRTKSSIILLGATLLYAIIAEILVSTVDVVLKNLTISEKFLGISIFAVVPNTTEFLNAISFAMNGNVALSMEIGTAYALQVCLLQIPALVLFSAFYISPASFTGPIKDYVFTLVFPRWDLYMTLFAVFIFTYVYGEGKSNYFKGTILMLTYCVVIAGFWFADLPLAANGLGHSMLSAS